MGLSCAMQMKGNTGNPRNGAIHWIYSSGLVMAPSHILRAKTMHSQGLPIVH